jgi:hypothetical protein
LSDSSRANSHDPPPALAVAFAAFCVWLIARIVIAFFRGGFFGFRSSSMEKNPIVAMMGTMMRAPSRHFVTYVNPALPTENAIGTQDVLLPGFGENII